MSQQAIVKSAVVPSAPLSAALAQRLGIESRAGWRVVSPDLLEALIRDALPALDSARDFGHTRLAAWLATLGDAPVRFWYASDSEDLDPAGVDLVEAVRAQLLETRGTGGEIYLMR